MRDHSTPKKWSVLLAAMALSVFLLMLSGCSTPRSETTEELNEDIADVTVAGVPPTFPPSTQYDGSGLSDDANALLKEIAALQTETDLCVILTGKALQPLLAGDLDTTNLVTSPSGLTQLLIAFNSTFSYIETIAPAEVLPAASTLNDVWTRVSSLNSGAASNQSQVQAILIEPQVVAAYESLATWAAASCDVASQ
jgi:hypothetical protein